VGGLTQTAREVRFVPVDFERDGLDEALAKSGHDASVSTTWIWEGVVMYLTPADIKATLAVIDRRSARGSHLVIAYHSPALFLAFVGLILHVLSEPLRSSFTLEEMSALLATFHFRTRSDEDVHTIGARLSTSAARRK
jgi:methyltransferase (TIGR00027 family)